MEDIQSRDHDVKLDYEREKNEIVTDIDRIELDHQQSMREVRNRTIDMEVESRKTKAEREKIIAAVEKEERQGEERLDELA